MIISGKPFFRVALLSLAVSSSVHAANATWNGTTNGTWSTAGNWSASPVPGTGNTATFNNAGNSNTTITTGSITVSTILFDTANAAVYTLGGATAGTGTIALNNSGAINVNNSVINNQLVNANVVLGTSSVTAGYSFTNNSPITGPLLTIAGSVSSGTSNSVSVKTLTLGGSGNGLVSGIISGNGSGSGSNRTAVVELIKSGTGVWGLSGANIYSGQTTVTQGTLLANNLSGTATGIGAVSVGVDGTLGGTGTIAPTGGNGINVSGVLAPGASVGTGNLTLNLGGTTGTVTMSSGSSFEYLLGVAGADINAVGVSDLLTLAGAVANDFAFSGNIIDFQSSGSVGFYKIFDTSANLASTWTGLTVNGTGLITGGLSASNLATGLSGNLIMGGGTLGGTSGDIYLQVIPEPSSAVLGGIGMLFLLRRRRNG